ncbi:fucose 4-O-acetylase-like acetyltransferase [Peribacillus deserti]|uniref:Fucose 4-O-acetylase-like acetyltransferase n=1 Tax=Peribacillus deserti TaxID=673318 RepID=A0ABS2QKX2_9BACI|nr:acyltransferase family protein [Peribacillus deserti]MBM7693113.1 fucose 4-O-acetylase-like acetyltransferase [Peribacillus deserti]
MKQRDYFFDNAKFILMVFVVFGHLLRTYIEQNEIIYTIYKVIYTFHMPGFILVSGFFAKGIYEKGYAGKLAKKLILPYLIFQIIYTIYYYYLYNKSEITFNLFDPQWALWFLISLFCWNLMLPLFARLKRWTGLGVALGLALAAGYINEISNFLSLSRTLVFFPIFLLGYHLGKDDIKKLMSNRARVVSAITFAAVFIWFYVNKDMDYKWLLGSKPYAQLEETSIFSMFKRLGLYGLSLMMVLSFFSFVPNKKFFFTNWGKQTLYVYLLHGFFIKFFKASEVHSLFTDAENFIMLAGISLILTIMLSSDFIASMAQPMIELKTTKLKQLSVKIKVYAHFFKNQLRKPFHG